MQECEVFTLNMKNYERLVLKRNKPTVDQMIDNAATKLLSRASRQSDIQVPLYRVLLHKICTIQQKAETARKRREGKVVEEEESLSNDVVPRRGPLIDQYGPGTVFHRSRMREQARMKQMKLKHGNNFRGATNFGAVSSTGGGYSNPDYGNTDNSNYLRLDKDDVTREQEEEEMEGPVYLTRSSSNPKKQFHDWRSSDKALSFLEEKIKQWHAGIASKPPKDPVKLKRVNVEVST